MPLPRDDGRTNKVSYRTLGNVAKTLDYHHLIHEAEHTLGSAEHRELER